MSVRIVTDSTGDLPLSYIKEHGLTVLSFPVTIGGKEYLVGPDENAPGCIATEEFYGLIAQGERATTAQIPLETYLKTFRSALEQGEDVLYLCFSSGLTGTMNSARLAAQELAERFPEGKVLFVDTKCASLGEGLIVQKTLEKMESEGGTVEELAAYAEGLVQKMKLWFTVNDLHYLAKGGRLSGSAAFVGSLLSVKPVMDMSAEGKLVPREKIQGRKKALKVIADKYLAQGDPAKQPLYIAYAGCEEDALFIKRYVEEKGGRVGMMTQVTPVIVSHTGLGVIAVCYFSDEPRNP
ncbi:MAG: DegV family protein [Eubacteriales bacterium]|nr:DegV family protein [Eubacteriales bacterium]